MSLSFIIVMYLVLHHSSFQDILFYIQIANEFKEKESKIQKAIMVDQSTKQHDLQFQALVTVAPGKAYVSYLTLCMVVPLFYDMQGNYS